MYLTHHLGFDNAIKFIKNEISECSAKNLLVTQVGAEKMHKAVRDADLKSVMEKL